MKDSAWLGRLKGVFIALPVEVLPVRSHLWRVVTVLVAPYPSATRPSGRTRQRVSSWGHYVESLYVDVVLGCGVGIGCIQSLAGRPQFRLRGTRSAVAFPGRPRSLYTPVSDAVSTIPSIAR